LAKLSPGAILLKAANAKPDINKPRTSNTFMSHSSPKNTFWNVRIRTLRLTHRWFESLNPSFCRPGHGSLKPNSSGSVILNWHNAGLRFYKEDV
jgi:hypothetical protein